jgi:hypothetical protein
MRLDHAGGAGFGEDAAIYPAGCGSPGARNKEIAAR